MPRTRQAATRDDKVGDILGLAQGRLREGGYDGLSIASIARELGIAQNTIYWYFPSKDHLFVATLERMLRQTMARKPSHGVGKIEQVLWFTDQFAALSNLRAAMTDRARSSKVVATFVAELDASLDRMMSNMLRAHVPPDELEIAVATFRATVEGTFVEGLDQRERRKVLRFTLERLLGQER
jgi:AcrR family transcriptional regulator